MKTCSTSPLILLKLVCITVLPVFEAQNVQVQPEVTGYLGDDVTLPCQFIPVTGNDTVTQVQWELKPPEGERITIIVFKSDSGGVEHNSSLKGRVKVDGQSLTIRNVEVKDAGLYTCNVATFPGGSLQKDTRLVVLEQMPLSSGTVSGIVIAVLLLIMIMAAIAYFIFIRRPDSLVRQRVFIDTNGPVLFRPSVIVREEDVVYSNVKLEPARNAIPLSRNRHSETDGDVTYSEVVVMHQQPK